MSEVIPAVIAKDLEELKRKISQVESYVNRIQIDVMDGVFVANTTWNKPEEINQIKTSAELEVHLMVNKPEEVIGDWINSGVSRIAFHWESTEKHREIIEKIKNNNLEAVLAVNPDTPLEAVYDFTNKLDALLIMTVNPGYGGQDFLEGTISKIKRAKEEFSDLKIAVDGGVNEDNIYKIKRAGADIVISGSAIFGSDDAEEAIHRLLT